jgi:fructokinase
MKSERPYQFAALGNAVVDAIAMVDDAFLAEYNLRKDDSNTVSSAEMLKLSSVVDVQQFRSGGSVANTAYTLAKLGARVAFLGQIGEDPTGRFFAEEMVNAGITIMPPQPKQRTIEVFILLTPDGSRTMVQSQPAAPSMDDTWVDETLVEQSEWLVLETYTMANTPAAVEFAAKVASNAGNKIVVSLATPQGVQVALPVLTDIVLKYEPLVIGTEEEWKTLVEGNDAATGRKLQGISRVLTKGGYGSSYLAGEGAQAITSADQPVINPLDTSGAGDAFAAGFLYTYAGGGSIELALKQGNQLGRATILQLGPRLQSLTGFGDQEHVLSGN